MNAGLISAVKLPDESYRNLSREVIESLRTSIIELGIKNYLNLMFPNNVISIVQLHSHHT